MFATRAEMNVVLPRPSLNRLHHCRTYQDDDIVCACLSPVNIFRLDLAQKEDKKTHVLVMRSYLEAASFKRVFDIVMQTLGNTYDVRAVQSP